MKCGVVYDRTWLEKRRLERGFTQKQVGEAAGITQCQYGRIEKGMYNPDVKAALRICDFLGLNPRNFLSEKPYS